MFADYDLILDGTDDADTRYLVNETTVAAKLPLGFGGDHAVGGPNQPVRSIARGAPCYACVFPEKAADGSGPKLRRRRRVLGPLPGVLGAMMAVEAIKHLVGAGDTLLGRMVIYDALSAEFRTIKIKRRPDCLTCG